MAECNIALLEGEVDELKQKVFEICADLPNVSLTVDDLEILETGNWCSWQPTYYTPSDPNDGIGLNPDDNGVIQITTLIKDFVYDKLKIEFDAYKAQFEAEAAFNYVNQFTYASEMEAYAGSLEASYAQLNQELYAQATEYRTAIANLEYSMSSLISGTESRFNDSMTASTQLYQQSYTDATEAIAQIGATAWLVDSATGKSVLSGFKATASSNTGSEFAIFADNFYIVSGATSGDGITITGTYKPFSIVNGVVTFQGQATDSTARSEAELAKEAAIQAAIDAENARLLAEGKPTLTDVQEWIIESDYLLATDVQAAIENNVTTISGSKITTGTIAADRIAANVLYGKQMLIDSNDNPRASDDFGGSLGLFNSQDGDNFNALAGVNYNASSEGNGIQGEHRGSGVGVKGVSIGGSGVDGYTFNSSHEWGLYTVNKTFSGQGFTPFTGSHIAYTQDDLNVGELVYSIDAWTVNINQALMHVAKTTTAKDKRVVGVVSYSKDTLLDNITDNEMILPEHQPYIDHMIENNFKEVNINALGEGGILVCNENGNIDNGDYLTSANLAGYACKQDDDILHSYTVAKALESVDWANEPQTTKLIACTYHAG